jgi:hypothetical protein
MNGFSAPPPLAAESERPRSNTAHNEELGRSRKSFFMTDAARTELLGWVVRALSNKKIVQKVDGHHSAVVLQHAWIFQFIDIIYVATIFKLSHLLGACGKSSDVYAMVVAYFVIMFSSRLQFDVYTCVSGASGILHVIAFCFYGMGVFVMTVNISSRLSAHVLTDDSLHQVHSTSPYHGYAGSITAQTTYGSCERSINYDVSFGIAFIFTRMVLVIMYGLYFYVFHESNLIGAAPTGAENMAASNSFRLSDLTHNSDLEILRESIASRDLAYSLDNAASVGAGVGTGMGASVAGTGNRRHVGFDVNNPINSTSYRGEHVSSHDHGSSVGVGGVGGESFRPSLVVRVARAYDQTAIKLHFNRIFLLKVAPVILSSMLMTMIFFGVSPVFVLPMVAGVEFLGDFLPSFFVNKHADWRELNPSREFLEERLGLFFMLVLGEVVLGLSAVNYEGNDIKNVYMVLL